MFRYAQVRLFAQCRPRATPRLSKILLALLFCLLFKYLVTIEVSLAEVEVALDEVRRYQRREGSGLLNLSFNNAKKVELEVEAEAKMEVAVDKIRRYTKEEIIAALPNLPFSYAKEGECTKWKSGCGRYPSLFDIAFSNDYWQVLHSSNGTFYLYSAFFDNRTLVQKHPTLRVLGMIDRIKVNVTTHCQVWYSCDQSPVITKVVEYRYIWIRAYGNYKQGILQPYLMNCILPPERNMEVPLSVSLVEERCDKATNNLRVTHNLPPEGSDKENFAVCVKGLSNPSTDKSLELAEWLELLFLLGAHKVFLYDMGIHPNISKLLRHYESQGRVEVNRLTLPGEQPNANGLLHMYLKAKVTHKRQNELIPYNDCLYKNMNRYKFIVLLDTDEIIMPRSNTTTWQALMEKVAPEVMFSLGHNMTSFPARHVYFLDSMQEGHQLASDAPKFMKIFQHVYRASNYTKHGYYIKSFHDPQLVLTLHNHFVFSCLSTQCRFKNIPEEDAHLQHYRDDCVPELRQTCIYFRNHTVRDTSVWRYKEPLIRNLLRTLRHLGFLKT